ncbi:hypothetical protein [Lentzea jiangxiensis]|uniref:hypothetical protein n=1 Tax=Lentzea jiangxiensis TaxID=641025 RepID=UPI001C40ABFC|nr:hypothetical protein [Lentzea jiangxiensis]
MVIMLVVTVIWIRPGCAWPPYRSRPAAKSFAAPMRTTRRELAAVLAGGCW